MKCIDYERKALQLKGSILVNGEGYDGKFIYLVSQKTFNVLDKIHSSVMTARFKTIEA